MKSTLSPVSPVNPAAPYIGGKRNLAKRITAMIAETPHQSYAEAFVGMGGVFFRRAVKPKSEVINDYSGEVANFFRILQRHYTPFVEMLRYQVTSRAAFNRLTNTPPSSLTDLERAARFLYLQKTAFSGKPSGQNFGVSLHRPGRFDATKSSLSSETFMSGFRAWLLSVCPTKTLSPAMTALRRYSISTRRIMETKMTMGKACLSAPILSAWRRN